MKNKMIITLLIVTCISVGVNVYQYSIKSSSDTKTTSTKITNTKLSTEEENEYSPMYKYFSSLTIDNFKSKVSSGDEFIVYIGRPDCSDCFSFEPTFIKLVKEHNLASKMYYLNVFWLHQDKDAYKQFKDQYNYSQTPSFISYKNGQQVSKIEWSDKGLPESDLKEWLTKNGAIAK